MAGLRSPRVSSPAADRRVVDLHPAPQHRERVDSSAHRPHEQHWSTARATG